MKSKLFYYPSAGKGNKYDNPYSSNLKAALGKYFDVFEANNEYVKKYRALRLFFYAFCADVFVLSWIEQIWKFSLGSFLTKASIRLMHLRGKRVIWIFHNLQPHAGENASSKDLKHFLLKHSDIILTHSKEAEEKLQTMTSQKIKYLCHPVTPIYTADTLSTIEPFDVLIWGAVLPYKGVLEFVSAQETQESGLRIRIVGKCKDQDLVKKIEKQCNTSISFENRYANFDELVALIRAAKWVLFPYIGESISSSGALIDTVVMGGCPIGPDRAAFHDLSEEGVCTVYKDIEEMISKLKTTPNISEMDRKSFIEQNSWDQFASKINELLKEQ